MILSENIEITLQPELVVKIASAAVIIPCRNATSLLYAAFYRPQIIIPNMGSLLLFSFRVRWESIPILKTASTTTV